MTFLGEHIVGKSMEEVTSTASIPAIILVFVYLDRENSWNNKKNGHRE